MSCKSCLVLILESFGQILTKIIFLHEGPFLYTREGLRNNQFTYIGLAQDLLVLVAWKLVEN